jgi:hypothetical protein
MKHEYEGETILIPATMMKHFTHCKDVAFTVGAKTIGASNRKYTVIVDRTAPTVTFPDHVSVAEKMTKAKPKAHIAMSTVLFKQILSCADGADNHIMRLFVRKPSEAMQITAKVEPGENSDGESVTVEVYAMPMFVDWSEQA